jgi:hypothetical protein
VIVAVELAAKLIGADAVAGAATVRVRTAGFDVVLAARNAFGDCSVEAVETDFSCGREDVGILDDALCEDALGALSVSAFGDDAAVVVGTSSWSDGVLVAAEAESSSAAFWAPPVACASPVLGSGVDGDGAFASDEDVAVVGFSLVEDESVELDDVALASVGSANAMPGMVAAAQPTPSATANAPTRPIYLTSPTMAPLLVGAVQRQGIYAASGRPGSKRAEDIC